MKSGEAPSDRAQKWFEEIVEPTVAEFLVQPDCKRKGCLAILAVASMTEHYFHARYGFHVTGESRKQFGPKLAKFRETIRDYKNGTGIAPIGMVADLANATKHVVSKNGMDHEGMKAERLNVYGVMRYGWPYGLGTEILVGENQEWRLVEILECCVEFWRVKLTSPV